MTDKKLIELTEILWPEKGSTEFKYRTITVFVDKIKYFGESKLKLSAPLEIACKIYRGEIPQEYYREVAKEMCTTIYFTDGTEINVKETRQEINKILEMPYDREEIKLMADEYQKPAWSEEDKSMLKVLREGFNILGKDEEWYSGITNGQILAWLKSFEERIQLQNTWKPSEEMLEALYRVIPENVMEKSENEMLLDKLYQGLKYGKVLSEKVKEKL